MHTLNESTWEKMEGWTRAKIKFKAPENVAAQISLLISVVNVSFHMVQDRGRVWMCVGGREECDGIQGEMFCTCACVCVWTVGRKFLSFCVGVEGGHGCWMGYVHVSTVFSFIFH